MEGHGKECEPDDPMELRGEVMPGDSRVMLDCIVEEYLACGYGAEQVLAMFESPFYQAAHGLLKIFGRDAILRIIIEKVGQSVAFRVQESSDADTKKGGEYGQGL